MRKDRWTVALDRHADEPLYVQLAEGIARLIEKGQLQPGERLPPHHDLAAQLDVNISTVTRAMSRLKQRGLLDSRPGRGTLVRAATPRRDEPFQTAPSARSDIIDLSVNRPPTDEYNRHLRKLLPRLPDDRRLSTLVDYQAPEGPDWARVALAEWFSQSGPQIDPERLVITEGTQHALACTLAAVATPGDVLLADEVTYQGINGLCRTLHLRLHGVSGDDNGMLPEALEAACREWQPRAVFLVPTLHNPTTVTLPVQRRRELLEVAQRFGILILEDDVYAPLAEHRLPGFADLDAERTIYFGGLSKCIAPGLRIGFMMPPARLVPDLAAAVRIHNWSVAPLTCLVATRLIEDGSAQCIVDAQKSELRWRNGQLAAAFEELAVRSAPTATHAWLTLAEPWRGASFANACQRRGIRVLAGEAFTLGRSLPPAAVRLNLAAARSRDDLLRALPVIRELAQRGHVHMPSTV